jgi:DNA processing protein
MPELDFYLASITHVGTQITNAYENPTSYDLDLSERFDYPDTLGAWEDLVNDSARFFRGRWFERYRMKFGASFSYLARFAAEHFASLKELGGSTVFYHDPCYPHLLRNILDPPFAFSILGNADTLLNKNMVAVVGSRRASPYAIAQSYDMGRFLQMNGICTVSGGAFGCDIAVHHGVLSTCVEPCAAIVVLAGGLNNFYPTPNAPIFHDIIRQGGVVLSEKLCQLKAHAVDFPIRNRIISGICERVLIMQAGVKSGAMLTANRALDEGREVFVLLHSDNCEAFSGNQKLVLDGAVGFDGVESYMQNHFFALRSVVGNA